MSTSDSDICLYLLALFLPPVAVTLKAGCGVDSLINSLLTLLGWLPGLLHAWYVIASHSSKSAYRAPPPPSLYPYSHPYSQSNGPAYGFGNQPVGAQPMSVGGPEVGTVSQGQTQPPPPPPHAPKWNGDEKDEKQE